MSKDEYLGRIGRRLAPKSVILCAAVLLLVTASTAKAAHLDPPGGYTISVTPKLLDGGKIELDIGTNIPGTIEIMADVALAGQKDDDLVIGTDGKVVTVHDGHARAVLDLVQVNSGTPLPAGTYDAEADFYPNWGFKDEVSRHTGIAHQIHGSHEVVLGGVQDAQTVERHMKHSADVMDWVFDHGKFGDPWKPQVWTKRFGPYVTLAEPFLDRDPARIKQEYFPQIDWTVIVNVQERIILTVAQGRGAKPGRIGGEE